MVSICIPVYNMHGRGVEFLKQALDSLQNQINKNFEIVVSDDSEDNLIEDFIRNSSYNNLKYLKNISGKKGNSGNLNNAIREARYEIIKPLFQDDWIVNDKMTDDIINSKGDWGVLGYKNSVGRIYNPRWNKRILFAGNTLGAPSGIWFKKTAETLFDNNLTWTMDIEFYYKLYTIYGKPKILTNIYYIVRVWEGQISSIIDKKATNKKELLYIKNKYKIPFLLYQWYIVCFMIFCRQKLRDLETVLNFKNNCIIY